MKYYDLYIGTIVFLKIIFYIMSLINIYFNHSTSYNSKLNNPQKIQTYVKKIRSLLGFIVTILISFLFIYIFNPYHPRTNRINERTNVIFFVFGVILLINAKWDDYIELHPAFVIVQEFFA